MRSRTPTPATTATVTAPRTDAETLAGPTPPTPLVRTPTDPVQELFENAAHHGSKLHPSMKFPDTPFPTPIVPAPVELKEGEKAAPGAQAVPPEWPAYITGTQMTGVHTVLMVANIVTIYDGEQGRAWIDTTDGRTYIFRESMGEILGQFIEAAPDEDELGPTPVTMRYAAKTTTQTTTDPGNTFISWSTVTQADAKILCIAARDNDNNDQRNIWLGFGGPGRTIALQRQTDSLQVQRFKVEAIVDHTTWLELTVTPISAAGAAFAGNNPLLVAIY